MDYWDIGCRRERATGDTRVVRREQIGPKEIKDM